MAAAPGRECESSPVPDSGRSRIADELAGIGLQLEACDQDPGDQTADQGDDSIGREPSCFVKALGIFSP